MLDVRLVVMRFDKLVDILRVIALVGTEVLLRKRSLSHDLDHQIIRRPFVMLIGSRDMDRQGRTACIHQKVNFASRFAAIGRIFAGFFSAEWRWHRLAVHRLPFPADSQLAGIVAHHDLEQLVKDTRLLPGLKAFMQGTTGNLKPLSLHGFPLTAGPQHEPDAVDDIPVVDSRPAGSNFLRRLGKLLFEFLPQFGRNLMIIYRPGFCVILVHRDVHLLNLGFDQFNFNRLRLFFQPNLFFG
jgi:hypothetical protein